MATKTNPNGANQYKVDPRQALFLSYYLDTKSDTFSNAYQSALRAGYEQEYAESITSLMPKWLSEYIGDSYLVKKAEKNLQEMLEMDDDDSGMKRIKADITKFVLERLNKEKYSPRQEFGGGDGLRKVVFEFQDVNKEDSGSEDKSAAGDTEGATEPQEQDNS